MQVDFDSADASGFLEFLRSSSGPNKPSVCPKTAPITSGFSTTPSISNLACITYFIVNVWDVPVIVSLLFYVMFELGLIA